MAAPLFRIASGVRSSGSTLMPPVQRIISTPSSAILRMAAVMAALSSPGVTWAAMVQPYSASFSSSTGVKASWISPFCTSLPVVTTPKVLARKGRSCKRGSGPATWRAFSMAVFSITSGMMRVPQSLSPLCTANPEDRVAIIMRPRALTARMRFASAKNSPSQSAESSILPSLGSEAVICSFRQRSRRISAASFSWSMDSSFSQT